MKQSHGCGSITLDRRRPGTSLVRHLGGTDMTTGRLTGIVLALAALLLFGPTPARADTPETPVVVALGGKVPISVGLRDLRGNSRPLDGFKNYKAVVLAFLGTECPISNLYLPSLVELEKKYRAQQ